MPSLLIRVLLFLSSYFPLSLIFAVQLYLKDRPLWAIAALSTGTLGLGGLWIYLVAVRKLNPISVKVEAVLRRDGEAMSYIVTYLLPFLALPSGDVGQSIGLAIFLFVLGVLYINSDMIHINPVLNLVGWHIYEADLANGQTCTLVARRRIRRGNDIKVVEIGQDLYLEARR